MVQGKYLILLFNGRLFYFILHYNLSSSFSAILFYVTVALLSLQIKQIKRGISSNSTNILLLHHKKQRNDYFIFKWKRISSRPPIMLYIAEVGFFVRSVYILIFKCTICMCTRRVSEDSNARQLRTQSVDDDLFFGSIKKGFVFAAFLILCIDQKQICDN